MSRLSDLDALLTSLGDTLTVEEMEYAIRDYQDREVRTVLANRAAAGGGTFNGGTITEPLVLTPASGSPAETINLSATTSAGITVNGAGQPVETYVLANDGNSTILEVTNGGAQLFGNLAGYDTLYIESLVAQDAGVNLVSVRPESGSNRLKITRGCFLKFKATAAPADAELDASECAFWFDSTNGAAKFKIKAKQADGTVVQGEIALAP